MSIRRIAVQQIGHELKLPIADLDNLNQAHGRARINGVTKIVLNPYADEQMVFEPSRGECHADETETWECVCDGIGHYGERVTIHVMECSECGRTYEHVNGGYECCPHCGRRIVEVSK